MRTPIGVAPTIDPIPEPVRRARVRTATRPVAVMTAMIMLLAVFAGLGEATAQAQQNDVVTSGLNGPQGVLIAPDGDIWVIEAGLGGDETIEVLNTETGEVVDGTLGDSARVLRIDADTGEQTEVVSLPSISHPEGTNGGARLALLDGVVYASVGEWADADTPAPAGMGKIFAIGDDGSATAVVDTWQHELDNDPDGTGTLSSHPYGIRSIDGSLWVADAGANALLSVDPATGTAQVEGVLDPIPGVFPRPDYGGEMLTDAVPTALAVGGDGRTYVSLLSGAPFVPGSAKVMVVGPDGSMSDHATGLTMLTDLVTGPDGNLYATQFAIFGEQGPEPGSGAVVRIGMDGSTEVVADGLSFVTAVDASSAGDLYVAVNGVGAPGSGEIIRLDGVALAGATTEAADEPLPATGSSDTTVILVIAAVTLVAAGALVLRTRRTAI